VKISAKRKSDSGIGACYQQRHGSKGNISAREWRHDALARASQK